MNEENLQAINNKGIEDLLKQVLAARVIKDDLFEEKIVDLLEPYPDISKDRIDEVLLYYTLKVAAERVSQPHKSKGYTESTLTTYESFNSRLRHLYIAGKYKSVFDLNISNLSRLTNVSVDVIAEMLNEITSSVYLVRERWQRFKDTSGWENRVIIGDGAMGTELYKTKLYDHLYSMELDQFMSFEWWNIEHQDEVRAVHEKYVEAGAQAVLTNTLGANSKKLEMNQVHKYTVEELNHAGVKIARQACAGADVLVFGKIGQSGCDQDLFLSDGDRPEKEKELYDVFKEQAVALWEEGADGIWIKGMSYLDEAVLAVKAAKESTGLPVICGMCFMDSSNVQTKTDFKTLYGDTVESVVNNLREAGAAVVGASCGKIVEQMPRLAREMREKTDMPLVFEMNAGQPRDVPKRDYTDYKAVYRLGADEFAKIMLEIVMRGGNIVGGCCGTGPEYIASLRRHVGRNVKDGIAT